MPKFVVKATQTKDYEIEVEAQDEREALRKFDYWVEDDFQQYQTGAHWEFVA